MNGIILILLPCLFGYIHGRSTGSANVSVIIRKPVRVCGQHLNDMLNKLCGTKFYSGPNELATTNSTFERSKRSIVGVVDECCKSSCSLEVMGKYCQDKPSYRNVVNLDGQAIFARATEKQPSLTKTNNNEVSKRGRSKGRRQRENNKLTKPIYVECMYRSFAHYLLKHSRRLERHRRGRVGDIIKKPSSDAEQHEGTATRWKYGGGIGKPNYSASS